MSQHCSDKEYIDLNFENAQNCLRRKNYGRAFAHFLLIAKLSPQKKEEIKDDFLFVMKQWTEELEKTNRNQDLFKCYDLACDLFSDCESVLNNIGAQLFRMGYPDEGALYVRRALKINPNFLSAKENLENICGHLVERWHFRMLNDVIRNTAFQQAITRAVADGHRTVLDIGAGTGLLSMYATCAGAAEVFACEQSKTMYHMASEIILLNRMDDIIQLRCKPSSELTIPEDIPARVPLVVTETVDAGLFGEHILSTLKHAWEHLIVAKEENSGSSIKSQVIPAGATVYACAVESEAILKQNRFLYPAVACLDLSAVTITCDTGANEDEPYTTENMLYLRGGYRQLSDTVTVCKVNFHDKQTIDDYLSGVTHNLHIPVTCNGRVDAILVWFSLHLDEHITLSSSPVADSCWEQAVFPVLPTHLHRNCDGSPTRNLHVKNGDEIQARCCCHDNRMEIRCSDIISNHSSSSSVELEEYDNVCYEISENMECFNISDDLTTKKDAQFSPRSEIVENITSDTKRTTLVNGDAEMTESHPVVSSSQHSEQENVFVFSREEIGFLNDVGMNRSYYQALQQVLPQLPVDHRAVLHLMPVVSVFGLQALKLGYTELTMVTEDEQQKTLTKVVMAANGIPDSSVKFIASDVNTMVDEEVGVILTDVVEPSGIIRQQLLEDLALLRLTSLCPGGVVIPGEVIVYGVCIQSEHLHRSSAVVDDDVTGGFHIADYFNDFQMASHVDIDLMTLPHQKLTETFKMMSLNFNETNPHHNIPSFLEQSHDIDVKVVESGNVTAIVYWFEIKLTDRIKLCTLDVSSHWRQAGVMQTKVGEVKAGGNVKVKVKLKNSFIDIRMQLD